MDYEIGEKVWFDGGPAKVIERSIEDRTYIIEFTGLTGRRTKRVTSHDLSEMPTFKELWDRNNLLQDKIREMEEEHARLINRHIDLQDRLDEYINNDPTI